MKRYFPGRSELLIFAIVAILAATIAANADARDAAMSLMSFPIFVGAAITGLWKSGRLRPRD